MPITVDDIETLRRYIDGVVGRADHHAHDVNEICFTIVGCIIWRSDSIRVYERQGNMTNALWIEIGPNRYAVSYDHSTGLINVKRDTMQGPVVCSFSNQNSAREVKDAFAQL